MKQTHKKKCEKEIKGKLVIKKNKNQERAGGAIEEKKRKKKQRLVRKLSNVHHKRKVEKKKKTDLSSRQFSITAVVVNHHLFLHNIVAHGAIHFEYVLFFFPFLLTSM